MRKSKKFLNIICLAVAFVFLFSSVAMAAVPAGIYIGDPVGKYYTISQFQDSTTKTSEMNEAGLPNVAYVDGENLAKVNTLAEGKKISEALKPIAEGDLLPVYKDVDGNEIKIGEEDKDELQVLSVSAIDDKEVTVVFAEGPEEDTDDVTIEVIDNEGNVVEVKAITVAAEQTEATFDFVETQEDQEGVWTIAGIEYDFDLVANLKAFEEANTQLALSKALTDLGIENVKVENMPKYDEKHGEFLAELEEDDEELTVEAIQAWVDEVNDAQLTEAEKEAAKKAAVEAVEEAVDAENDIALLAALEEHFDRVNAEWFEDGYKVKIAEMEELKFDAIQEKIDGVNTEKIQAAWDTVWESVKSEDLAKVKALVEYIADDSEGQVVKEYYLDEMALLEAVIKVNNATTNNRFKTALTELDNLENALVKKYKDTKVDEAKNAFTDELDLETVNNDLLKDYRDELDKIEEGNKKNQPKDIQVVIDNVNADAESDAKDKVLEDLNNVNEKTAAADVVALLQQAVELHELKVEVKPAYAEAYKIEVTDKTYNDINSVKNSIEDVNYAEDLKLGLVSDEEGLKKVLTEDAYKDLDTITLAANITINEAVTMRDNLTIDGAGYTLVIGEEDAEGNNTAEGLYIPAGTKNAVIRNLTVRGNHKDNLIEIYSDATLENVKAIGGSKAGIYVNNDGEKTITVNFKDITTRGNGWNAGIGLLAQQLGDKVIVNFAGNNTFYEDVAVYAEYVDSETEYLGEYEVNGLDGYEETYVVDKKTDGTKNEQSKWVIAE